MKKKIMALIATMAMTAMMFAGCGKGKDSTTAPTTAANNEPTVADEFATGNEGIFKGAVLQVGMSVGYPNFEEYDVASGKPVGLDLDILNYMANDLGFTYEIQDMKLPQVVAALQSNNLNLSISGMYETEARTEVIDMSKAYLTAKNAVLIREADKDKYKTLSDFAGNTLCCNIGEAYYESVLKSLESSIGSTTVEFEDTAASIAAVLGGQSDGRIVDAGSAKKVSSEYEELTYIMLDDSQYEGIDANHYSMGFVKDSIVPGSTLTYKEVFNAEIEKMKKNGELKKIISNWLGEDFYDLK